MDGLIVFVAYPWESPPGTKPLTEGRAEEGQRQEGVGGSKSPKATIINDQCGLVHVICVFVQPSWHMDLQIIWAQLLMCDGHGTYQEPRGPPRGWNRHLNLRFIGSNGYMK